MQDAFDQAGSPGRAGKHAYRVETRLAEQLIQVCVTRHAQLVLQLGDFGGVQITNSRDLDPISALVRSDFVFDDPSRQSSVSSMPI